MPDPGAPRHPELPADLLAAALVGTNRRPWSGESSLLEAAAIALARHRAGVLPAAGRSPVPAGPGRDHSALPTAAGLRLIRILGEGVPGGAQLAQELLAQWLAAAAAKGGHVPPVALPALLEAGRRNSIDPARAGAGRRPPRHLAGRHARRLAVAARRDGAVPLPSGAGRRSGRPGRVGERLGYLTAAAPDRPGRAGRDLLADDLGAGVVRRPGPVPDRARDRAVHRRRPVPRRRPSTTGARRCARPRSTCCAGCPARRWAPGWPSGRARDAAASGAPVGRTGWSSSRPRISTRRCAATASAPPRPAASGSSAWLLEEVVAGAPLDTWTPIRRLTDAVSTWPAATTGRRRCCTAGPRPPSRSSDADWASALVNDAGDAAALREAVRWDLHLVLPPDELARIAADVLRREDGIWPTGCWPSIPGDWPDELAVAVLETIAHRARTDRHSWQLGRAVPRRRAGHAAGGTRARSRGSPPSSTRSRPTSRGSGRWPSWRAPSPSATRCSRSSSDRSAPARRGPVRRGAGPARRRPTTGPGRPAGGCPRRRW